MRVGRALLVLAAVAAVAVAATPIAQAAPGKLIAKDSDSGLPTANSTDGRALNPRALLVQITATPTAPVQVTWDTSCARGGKGRVREGSYTVTGADIVSVTQGFKRPDDCLINVAAAYEDASQEGTIVIEVFARGRFVRRG